MEEPLWEIGPKAVVLFLPSDNDREQTMSQASKKPDWMTTEEVAEQMRCSARKVQRLVADGELEAKRDGKRFLIPRWSYEAYMQCLPGAV